MIGLTSKMPRENDGSTDFSYVIEENIRGDEESDDIDGSFRDMEDNYISEENKI